MSPIDDVKSESEHEPSTHDANEVAREERPDAELAPDELDEVAGGIGFGVPRSIKIGPVRISW